MEYRKAGNSTLELSVIGFGCMSLPMDQAAVNELINSAIEKGINFFDTADIYNEGQNEKIIGNALHGKRQNIIIATKVGNQPRADKKGWDWNPKKEYIIAAAEKSLKRLQTDYIDLYQLHGGTIEDPIDETIEAFEQLKRDGKIRHYGISSIRPNVIREYIKRSSVATVMMQYSLLDRRPEEECLSLLKENNIGMLARGVLGKGLLAGKTAASFLNYTEEEVKKIAGIIRELSSSSRTPAAIAIRFVLQQEAVTSAITGIRTIQQLVEITDAVSGPPLNDKEIKTLEMAIPVNTYTDHR